MLSTYLGFDAHMLLHVLLSNQACELLPASKRQGEWYFCRGMLLSEIQQFKTYKELGMLERQQRPNRFLVLGSLVLVTFDVHAGMSTTCSCHLEDQYADNTKPPLMRPEAQAYCPSDAIVQDYCFNVLPAAAYRPYCGY